LIARRGVGSNGIGITDSTARKFNDATVQGLECLVVRHGKICLLFGLMLVLEGNLLDTVVVVALDNAVVKGSTRRPIGVGVGVVPTVLVERWCRLVGLQ